MHYSAKVIVAAIAGLFAQSGCADAPGPEVEERLERLVSQSPKMHLPELIEYNQAKLERIYQAKLQATKDPELRAALEKAQKAWREFHEADRTYGALDLQGGSGQAVFAMERHVYQLRLRIYQLSTEFLAGWTEIPKVDERHLNF